MTIYFLDNCHSYLFLCYLSQIRLQMSINEKLPVTAFYVYGGY
jgi:hypothetical protein